jgi:hypothetical protein
LNLDALNGWIVGGGLFLSLFGELIRILAVGFSGAGTSGRENYMKAERINSTGIYSLSRNPLYIGNFLIFSGLLVVFANGYALLIVTLFLIFQYYFIIQAEESYLTERHGEEYGDYCARVPRIFGGIRSFQKSKIPFNLPKVIYKENDSLFNLLMVFIIILVIRELSFYHGVIHKIQFIGAASLLTGLYILIKVLKKRNKIKSEPEIS